MFKVVGIYVILSGVLLGLAVGITVFQFVESWDIAFLAFMGASGTTIGIGFLVIIGGEILGVLRAAQGDRTEQGQSVISPPQNAAVQPPPAQSSGSSHAERRLREVQRNRPSGL